jgi:hypothetical protein
MILRIGQKVVCVDDSINQETRPYVTMLPRTGGIYTVRGFDVNDHIEGYGVYLEELVNPTIIWADGDEKEWAFKPERFRPLIDTKIEYEQLEKA